MSQVRASTGLAFRLALRDLRGGLYGFGIFLACIALGVGAITGVGSVSRSLSDGLAQQGRVILGGDASFDLVQRPATADERAFLQSRGALDPVTLLRAMARAQDGLPALIELKSVPAGYPRIGHIALEPPMALDAALAKRDGAFGIVADPALQARLALKIGDVVHVGTGAYVLRALLLQEPDKLAAGIGFGPRVLMSEDGLAASGLVQPGSLLRHLYRVALPERAGQPPSLSDVSELVADANKRFPSAGWEVRTRANVSPQFTRDLQRFTQFLTLVGLTALVIGGVGVANAVRGFVERRRPSIATLKSLGATGGFVFATMLIEVMMIAAIGVAIGLVIGMAMPFAVAWGFSAVLPIPLAAAIYPAQVATGLLYGFMTALAFALAPLGRTHAIAVSALFRDHVDPDQRGLPWRYRLMTAAAGLALVGAILLLSDGRWLAIYYLAAVAAGFFALRLVAVAVMAVAARLPQTRFVALRLAIANIHRPGALTPTVVLSLGLGLALLVALTLIDGNIRAQLARAAPGETPSFFFLDVQSAEAPAFESFLKRAAPDGTLEIVPMMRGRIVRVNGTSADSVKPGEKAAWALQGDRGITFSADLPKGSQLVKGTWWSRDYAGKPLVSLEKDIADGLGLTIGDSIDVNVFGRDVSATVANIRKVDWRKFGINFVLVFSPNTFAGAPYGDLATVTFPSGAPASRELGLLRDVAKSFPSITSIRVKDALDSVSSVVGQLATAIRGAAGVALVASVLVLAGALAAGQEARLYDAVVLKTLGATRGRLLAAFLLEYGLIGFATALFGVLAGLAAAYGIVVKVMALDFVWLWPQAFLAAAGALVVTILLGLLGTWRILGRKPASYLRSL